MGKIRSAFVIYKKPSISPFVYHHGWSTEKGKGAYTVSLSLSLSLSGFATRFSIFSIFDFQWWSVNPFTFQLISVNPFPFQFLVRVALVISLFHFVLSSWWEHKKKGKLLVCFCFLLFVGMFNWCVHIFTIGLFMIYWIFFFWFWLWMQHLHERESVAVHT